MVVRSILVTNGYFNNSTATADAFITLPDSPPSPSTSTSTPEPTRWFCTGDIAVLRNNKFYIVDRLKELLKYKGQQVAPAELENTLAAHPLIAEAAVVGVPGTDADAGEVGSDLPRAYVVMRPGKEVGEEQVKDWVKQRLAPYKQLRGGVVFVDEIPKNAIGKYLRRELRERARREVEGVEGKARL
jgi:4-coumarate--CoA ligase